MKQIGTHRTLFAALALLAAGLAPAPASADAAAPPMSSLSPRDRDAVLQTLRDKLKAHYVFPQVAERVVATMSAKAAAGAYAGADSAPALAELLSKDLREASQDKHFIVRFDPQFHEDAAPDAVPSAQEMENRRVEVLRLAYGVEKVQRLPGNVGYLELRGFGPTEWVGPAYNAAMLLLAGTDALILDLRRNGGGDPGSVTELMSHFFALGDERHLNDIYTRTTDSTQQYWTTRSSGERYTKPVYVLTSARTFSGGEECAYDFQTQKRAVLVGETTGGGAHPVDGFSLGHGLQVNIPTAKAINPVTHTDWEHVGVRPDVAVPAAQALQTAHTAILRQLLPTVTDPEDHASLERILARVEKGETEVPVYTPRP
jgi:hypothetical protein